MITELRPHYKPFEYQTAFEFYKEVMDIRYEQIMEAASLGNPEHFKGAMYHNVVQKERIEVHESYSTLREKLNIEDF